MNSKLSPELRHHVRVHAARSRAARGDALASALVEPFGAEPGPVGLAIAFTGSLEDLKAAGFQVRSVLSHPTRSFSIATGTVMPEHLEALAAIEHVVELEGDLRMRPQLNFSVPEIRADAVHVGPVQYRGKCVIVGVIDSGIDWRHASFVTPAGDTRILALWDMRLTANATEQAGPNGVGVLYDQSHLNSALHGDPGSVRSLDDEAGDEGGHGTHVTGIAAGNGIPATCCHTGKTYVGVAPEADIVFVRYPLSLGAEFGASSGMIAALGFIFEFAKGVNKPAVANISLGANLGPHDGTSLLEQTIDMLMADAPGRAVVVAAGNETKERTHVQGSVPGHGNVEVEFSTRDGFESFAQVDVWYARAGTLNLELIEGSTSLGTTLHGQDGIYVANDHDATRFFPVVVDGTINGLYGRDNNFRIRMQRPRSGNIPTEDWKLNLINPSATAVTFHCWIESVTHQPVFLAQVNPPDGKVRASADATLTIPSTAATAFCVANHESRTDFWNCFPSTGIRDSSSRGPVARNAAANPKPDLAAPGLQITSAKADAANLPGNCCSCCPDACCCLYQDLDGTSMSAPHVTGAIALMLELNPRLTREGIFKHLKASARPPPPGGTPETWGMGKLDVQAAMQSVWAESGWGNDACASSSGGGGGGGGGGGLSGMSLAEMPRASVLPPSLRILRARLLALPEGELLASTVSRHFSEVRRLINTNRRVATLWHRGSGPRMLRCLLDGALDPRAPAALEAQAQREYVERWWGLLARYGSPKLRAGLVRHRERVFNLLSSPLAAQVHAFSPEVVQ
ncbi:S8 family serine peptidase [Corallococcus sp. bb12-1]|uniref:S8 family serine peptidase n=1 Tax=Corallococcus sp. bb12-1 TaxID=2996784 RepID=UPI002271E03E|nr:S8 family serine peptidase [Corallococcus sp. bb12-1]MCY1039706.1 S8 family serine peptidase [Corallococcus sp. bb12-1]